MVSIVRLLRWWRDTHPERITASLQARLTYIANGSIGHYTPRDGYSGQITDALRAACLKDIPQVTERLTVLCDQKLAEGRDPEEHGWEDPHNVLWHIAHYGVISAHLRQEEPTVSSERVAHSSLSHVHVISFPFSCSLPSQPISPSKV